MNSEKKRQEHLPYHLFREVGSEYAEPYRPKVLKRWPKSADFFDENIDMSTIGCA